MRRFDMGVFERFLARSEEALTKFISSKNKEIDDLKREWRALFEQVVEQNIEIQALKDDIEYLEGLLAGQARTWSGRARVRRAKRDEILTFLGGSCAKCGENNPRVLQIDHIWGGGSQHRREVGQVGFFEDVLEYGLAEFQLLCPTCNCWKRYTHDELRRNRGTE